MADEIDIEEHDLIDNPLVKTVFPDLSIVKKEIIDFDDIPEPQPVKRPPPFTINAVSRPSKTKLIDEDPEMHIPRPLKIPKVERTESLNVVQNKQLLIASKIGITKINKPVVDKEAEIEAKKRLLKVEDEVHKMKSVINKIVEKTMRSLNSGNTAPRAKQFTGNKIILGTKKAPETKTNNVNEIEKCLNVRLVLKDIGTGLKTSKSYCGSCQTLFKDKESYSDHVQKEHTPKRVYECAKANCNETFSTAWLRHKHNQIAHTTKNNKADSRLVNKTEAEADIEKGNSVDKANLCGHCNTHFPSKESLITHLYEILQPGANKKFKCRLCSKTFPSPKSREIHTRIHKVPNYYKNRLFVRSSIQIMKKQYVTRKKPTKPAAEETIAQKLFKCHFCSYYLNLKDIEAIRSHYKNIHKDATPQHLAESKFTSECDLCDESHESIKQHNAHVKESHFYSMDSETFQCGRCLNTFSNYNTAYSHVAKHRSDAILLKLSATGEYVPVHETGDQLPIPLDILFKCDSCHVHFVHNIVPFQHAHFCTNHSNYDCEKCGRTLKKADSYNHDHQHMFSDEFNVIQLAPSRELCEHILCKCHKCGVNYTEDRFWTHYEGCGADVPKSHYCYECDVLIDSVDYGRHTELHSKFSKEQFTVLEYNYVKDFKGNESVAINNDFKAIESDAIKKDKLKRKLVSPDDLSVEKQHKKINSENAWRFRRFCPNCRCFIQYNQKRYIAFHITKQCKGAKSSICNICGLVVTPKMAIKHKQLHNFQKGITLSDFEFYNLHDNQKILPPQPVFPFCVYCKTYYKRFRNGKHSCKEPKFFCSLCKKYYSQIAFRFHEAYHNYRAVKSESDRLHQCSQCDAMMTASNLAAHRNVKYDCRTLRDKYKRCGTCDISIVGKDFDSHKAVHERDKGFDRNSLTVIPFHKRAPGKVGLGSHVNSTAALQKDTKYIYYQCRNCKLCLRLKSNIEKHICMGRRQSRKCSRCKLVVRTSHFSRHLAEHAKKADLKNSQIEIRYFGKGSVGYKANKSLLTGLKRKIAYKNPAYSDNGSSIASSVHDDKLVGTYTDEMSFLRNKEGKYLFFQCRNCKMCVRRKKNMKRHTCTKGNYGVKCKKCRMSFHVIHIRKHLAEHKRFSDLKNDKIELVYFGKEEVAVLKDADENSAFSDGNDDNDSNTASFVDEDEIEDRKRKKWNEPIASGSKEPEIDINECNTSSTAEVLDVLHQCVACRLNFNDGEACVSHKCDKVDTLSCDECSLKFDKINYYEHELRHAEGEYSIDQIKIEKFDPKDMEKTALIYKCKCGLHFVTRPSIEKHYLCCSPKLKATRQKCTKCKLLFLPNILFEHLIMHHGNKSDFKYKVIEIRPETNPILYKCSSCELHFIDKDKMGLHVSRCYPGKKEKGAKVCTECKLTFPLSAFERHVEMHHGSVDNTADDYDIRIVSKKDFVKIENLKQIANESMAIDNLIKDEVVVERRFKECNYKMDEKNYNNELFYCKPCKVHFIVGNTFNRHIRDGHKKTAKDTCMHCGFAFSEQSLSRHLEIHHKRLQLKPEDFVIKTDYTCPKRVRTSDTYTFKDSTLQRSAYGNVLYKCSKCNLHFLLENTLQRHIVSNHPALQNTVKCDICKILFSENSYSRHKMLHHVEMNYTLEDLEIIERGDEDYHTSKDYKGTDKSGSAKNFSEVIFKCVPCDLHFALRFHYQKHFAAKHIERKIETCRKCNLSFSGDHINRHKYFHHDVLKIDKFEIRNIVDTRKGFNKQHVVSQPELFKCKTCDLHYLKNTSCVRHMYEDQDVDSSRAHPCNECGLKFRKASLRIHKTLHHSDAGFKLTDFKIIEYDHNLRGPVTAMPLAMDDDSSIIENDGDNHTNKNDSLESDKLINESNIEDDNAIESSNVSVNKILNVDVSEANETNSNTEASETISSQVEDVTEIENESTKTIKEKLVFDTELLEKEDNTLTEEDKEVCDENDLNTLDNNREEQNVKVTENKSVTRDVNTDLTEEKVLECQKENTNIYSPVVLDSEIEKQDLDVDKAIIRDSLTDNSILQDDISKQVEKDNKDILETKEAVELESPQIDEDALISELRLDDDDDGGTVKTSCHIGQ